MTSLLPLSDATPYLQKLAYRKNLTTAETRAALDLIGAGDTIADVGRSDGLFFLALTFGLMAKGPTADELYGFVASIRDQSETLTCAVPPEQLIDISGTGGDRIKTHNVGTTASFIVAAAGVHVAKQATRGYTGFSGSADICREIGMDPFQIDAARAVKCLETVGIVAFYAPSFSPGFKTRIDFLTKLKTIGLCYPTPWHLVSWVHSPIQMYARLYGVFDQRYVPIVAELFRRLGYRRVMVVHGVDGLDEISNVGETAVAELSDGRIREYTLTPEECGVRRAAATEIQTLTDGESVELSRVQTDAGRKAELRALALKRNLTAFFEILYGADRGPRRDLVTLNAGAALYLSGKSSSMASGVALANRIVDDGRARALLYRVAAFNGGETSVRRWEKHIGL